MDIETLAQLVNEEIQLADQQQIEFEQFVAQSESEHSKLLKQIEQMVQNANQMHQHIQDRSARMQSEVATHRATAARFQQMIDQEKSEQQVALPADTDLPAPLQLQTPNKVIGDGNNDPSKHDGVPVAASRLANTAPRDVPNGAAGAA